MSHQARLEYLKAILERYRISNRPQKKAILDEFCVVCGYTRKYAIRILNRGVLPSPSSPRGRPPKYPPEQFTPILYWFWLKMGKICSKRMKEALPEWSVYCKLEFLTPERRDMLLNMSAATIERLLKRARTKVRGISSTRPSKRFLSQIPIQAKDWNITKPGTVQADTVAHTHTSLEGSYANSLTVTDIFSGWTENRAVWTKSTKGVIDAMSDIERSLPFAIETFKSDSGVEFMNYRFVAYFKERNNSVNVVRSRPYRKNDNCYVEQKNFTHVRELFGYSKIDQPEMVEWMNNIYKELWNPLHNFFLPSAKLLRKVRVGSRIQKQFDKAKTPFQRLIESNDLSDSFKQTLLREKMQLNPFSLAERLELQIKLFNNELRKRFYNAA